jgi:16S rRNA (guanine(527)-N(7))-methyltransferase RsmG
LTDIEKYFQFLDAEQMGQLDSFARLLIEQSKIHNLTAVTDPEGIRIRHFADSLVVADIIKQMQSNISQKPQSSDDQKSQSSSDQKSQSDERESQSSEHKSYSSERESQSNSEQQETKSGGRKLSLIDIGSGAGFPGFVLAVAFPDISIVSLEATAKKVHFQQLVVKELGLKNVRVINCRAEELAHDRGFRKSFDIATARAVCSLAALSEIMLPLVRHSGKVLAWKGPSGNTELAEAEKTIKLMGGKFESSLSYCLPQESPEWNAEFQISLSKVSPTPARFPRQWNAIKKSPPVS